MNKLKLRNGIKGFILIQRKGFSINISDKEKRLGQFFKLPKHKLEFSDKVFDRPAEDYTVLKSLNDQEIDKMDMMDKVIKKKKLESERSMDKFFSSMSTMESMKITENLVEKLRMKKEFKFTQEFKQKQILDEYGNYDKYFENYRVMRDRSYDSGDDGESTWERKYSELQEKFKNPATKKTWQQDVKELEEEIKKNINSYGADFTFSDYMNMKQKQKSLEGKEDETEINPRSVNYKDVKPLKDKLTPRPPKEEVTYDIRLKRERVRDNKAKLYQKVERQMKRDGFIKEEQYTHPDFDDKPIKINGRVSPWCKEEIYKNYLEGWTVKDLSYKYGLLPERVKVIIFMRDFFWKEVYPKIGETGLRRRMEEGFEYAKKFGYIDYGKDLEEMANREQGIHLKKVFRGEIDCKPTKEIEEKISSVLKKVTPKAIDNIPIKFYGKGCSGYLIKEMICKTGQGSRRVSKNFKKYCYYKDLHPHLLPKKVLVKKEAGPRIATLGSRF